MNTFFGVNLSRDQCWDMYQADLEYEEGTYFDEAGYTQSEILALKDPNYAYSLHEENKDKAFDQMEKDQADFNLRYQEYMPPTEEESEFYHNIHHLLNKDVLPAWKILSDNITKLLNK